MAEDKEKKIIIDEDWKQQAQKEKEELAAQQEKEEKQPRKLPKGDFSALVNMLVTNVFFALGIFQFEGQQEAREPDFHMAKYNIDMLETLREKTKGNLDENESKMLDNIIREVQNAFVKVSGG